jgi:hypothetical protein
MSTESAVEYDFEDNNLPDVSVASEERERFHIIDDAQAAWAMRKLLALRSKVDENTAIADQEVNRIQEWLHRVNGKFDSDITYFEAILKIYAQKQRESDGRKTIETPYGVVKSRATSDKFRVVDEEAFFAWAEANLPDAIAVKRSPSLTVLKEKALAEHTDTLGMIAMTTDGEIIPGVDVEAGGINFTIEVSK